MIVDNPVPILSAVNQAVGADLVDDSGGSAGIAEDFVLGTV